MSGSVIKRPLYLNICIWEAVELQCADPTLYLEFTGTMMVARPKYARADGKTLVFDADYHFPLPYTKKRGKYQGPTEFSIRVYSGSEIVGRLHADFSRVHRGVPRSWWLPVERSLQEFFGAVHVGLLLSARPEPVPRQAEGPSGGPAGPPRPGTPARASTPARVGKEAPATGWIEISPTAGPRAPQGHYATAAEAAERAAAIAAVSEKREWSSVVREADRGAAVWQQQPPPPPPPPPRFRSESPLGRSTFERVPGSSHASRMGPFEHERATPVRMRPPPGPLPEPELEGVWRFLACISCLRPDCSQPAEDALPPHGPYLPPPSRNQSLLQRFTAM